MSPAQHKSSITAFRADALFVSALQRSDTPTAGQIRQAIEVAVAAFGGPGCAERVAQEFGDHPETAAARMRWARAAAGAASADLVPEPRRSPDLTALVAALSAARITAARITAGRSRCGAAECDETRVSLRSMALKPGSRLTWFLAKAMPR